MPDIRHFRHFNSNISRDTTPISSHASGWQEPAVEVTADGDDDSDDDGDDDESACSSPYVDSATFNRRNNERRWPSQRLDPRTHLQTRTRQSGTGPPPASMAPSPPSRHTSSQSISSSISPHNHSQALPPHGHPRSFPQRHTLESRKDSNRSVTTFRDHRQAQGNPSFVAYGGNDGNGLKVEDGNWEAMDPDEVFRRLSVKEAKKVEAKLRCVGHVLVLCSRSQFAVRSWWWLADEMNFEYVGPTHRTSKESYETP